jgi:choloylglycine hydrolase
MKKSIILVILLLMAHAVFSQEEEKKEQTPPQSKEMSLTVLAQQLADYGYANKDPLSILAAAKIIANNPVREFKPQSVSPEKTKGTSPVTPSVLLNPQKLLDDAKKISNNDPAIVALADQITFPKSKGSPPFTQNAGACSVMMKTNKQGVFVGRSSDFFLPLKTRLEVIPAGYKDYDPISKFRWTTKYGVVGVNDFNILYEGMNQKGFNAHILLQEDAQFPVLVPNKQTWGPKFLEYLLTTCATVNEALDKMQNLQLDVRPVQHEGIPVLIKPHMAFYDSSGDAAVVEFNDGKMEIFHGPQYNVLANAPNLHKQQGYLANIREGKTQFSIASLPGGADSKCRFVRMTFDMENMPEPASPHQAVIFMEEAIHNIEVPAYIDTSHVNNPAAGDAWETRWHVVLDVKNLKMYFDNDQIGKRINLDLNKIDFNKKEIEYIDPATSEKAISPYGW